MIVPVVISISLILGSQPPGSTCNWEVGELDHDYQGYRASHRCNCPSSSYTGPACRECTKSETALADGGASTSTRCLQKDMGGCSSAQGLAPCLAVIVLFALGRRRARRTPRWAVP
jgi:hypothetical protein